MDVLNILELEYSEAIKQIQRRPRYERDTNTPDVLIVDHMEMLGDGKFLEPGIYSKLFQALDEVHVNLTINQR